LFIDISTQALRFLSQSKSIKFSRKNSL